MVTHPRLASRCVSQGLGACTWPSPCRLSPLLTRFRRGLSPVSVDRLDWMDLVEGPLSGKSGYVLGTSTRPSHHLASSSAFH